MNFGQGHGLAVKRPSSELSFLTQHFNQVQSHFLISTTLIYPANGYHELVLAHPSSGDLMPLHSTLPRHSIEPCHLYSVDAIMPGLPYNWQPSCTKFLSRRAGSAFNYCRAGPKLLLCWQCLALSYCYS